MNPALSAPENYRPLLGPKETERAIKALKDFEKIVRKIYAILKRTEHFVFERYPAIRPLLPEEIV